MITNAISRHHQPSLLFSHAILQQLNEHLRTLAVPDQKERPTSVAVHHVILERIFHIPSSKFSIPLQNAIGLGVGFKNHLTIIRSIEVVIVVQHLVETLVAVSLFPHLSLRDISKPRGVVVDKRYGRN